MSEPFNPYKDIPLAPKLEEKTDGHGVKRRMSGGQWKIVIRPVPWETLEAALEDNHFALGNVGFCVACGAEHHECEPDARRYTCEVCENKTVYSADEINIAGWVTFPPEGLN